MKSAPSSGEPSAVESLAEAAQSPEQCSRQQPDGNFSTRSRGPYYFVAYLMRDAAAKCRGPMTAFCTPHTCIIGYTRQCVDSRMCPPTDMSNDSSENNLRLICLFLLQFPHKQHLCPQSIKGGGGGRCRTPRFTFGTACTIQTPMAVSATR